MSSAADPRLGLSVTHRRYVSYADAHYGGNLVDGAYALALFGDVATEACIRMDGDEGLFASYSDVQFRAPVQAGDVIEATAAVTAIRAAQPGAEVQRPRWSAGPTRRGGPRPRPCSRSGWSWPPPPGPWSSRSTSPTPLCN